MIVSDANILAAIQRGDIAIKPFIPSNVQLASIVLTLHSELATVSLTKTLDVEGTEETCATKQDFSDSVYMLKPGCTVYGSSQEIVRFSPAFAGSISNLQNLALCGLDASCISHVPPGYQGRVPLALCNLGRQVLILRAGMPICQLVVHAVEEACCRTEEDTRRYVREKVRSFKFEAPDNLDTSLSDYFHELLGRKAERPLV